MPCSQMQFTFPFARFYHSYVMWYAGQSSKGIIHLRIKVQNCYVFGAQSFNLATWRTMVSIWLAERGVKVQRDVAYV